MKVLLATSIFPPDIGGPAVYAQNLKQGLAKQGVEVGVCSYQGLNRYPQPLKFWLYTARLLKKARGCDIIYAFNPTSCGLPALKVAKVLRKKLVVRLGGDFLWERAVEKGRTRKPLREYYGEPKSLGEKLWLAVMRMVLKRVNKIVFTTNLQKEIYQQHFGLKQEKVAVIPNPFPETEIINPQSSIINNQSSMTSNQSSIINHQLSMINYQLLYAGRLLKLKNLDTLIKVFADVLKRTEKPLTLKIIGEGPEEERLKIKAERLKLEDRVIFEKPLAHQELLKKIQQSYLCVLPSLTEISPNFALECIKLGKPILLTKETGIYEQFKNDLIFIDPQNPDDLKNKIIALLDENNYQPYLNKISQVKTDWTWHKAIKTHLSILSAL